MPTFNSQVLYNFGGDSKPAKIKQEEEDLKLVKHEDFMNSIQTAEQALGQKIVQDNADSTRLLAAIQEQSMSILDTGTATLPEAVAQINKLVDFIGNQLVQVGKNRS